MCNLLDHTHIILIKRYETQIAYTATFYCTGNTVCEAGAEVVAKRLAAQR